MPSVSEIMVSIRVDDAELGKLDAAGQKIDAMGQRGESVGRSMQTVGLGMAAVGAAGGAMFGAALKGAADFEQQMDFVGAALGGVGTASGVTEQQFASLQQQAMDLGSSTQYSAEQVASVQEALGKTGVSAEDLLSGATSAVLDLSAATGEDLVSSANVAAAAMNTFGLKGEDLGRIADVTTGALNNSSMSLADFSTGMNYLSPILAQTGGDFDDAAAAIAYFNSQGMKGADAGVSLARMIDNLVRPKNKDAAAMFKELGISAFDAEGQMKTVPDMLDNIQQALQGLNEQEQLELVSKLFGAESADVVLRSLSGAGQGIRDMNEDITQSGIASEQAAQRMDNWKGDLETLSGSIDVAGKNITNAFMPALRSVTQFATSAVDAFNGLPAPVQAAVGAFLAIGSAVTGGLGAALLVVPKIVEFGKAFTTLKAGLDLASLGMKGFTASLGPIGIALAVISVAILAYQNNWLGFRDAVNQVADALGPKLQQAATAAGNVLKNIGNALKPLAQGIADTAGRFKDWLGAWKPLQGLMDAAGDALGFLADRFMELDDRTKILLIAFGPLGAAFLAAEAGVKALGAAFSAVAGPIGAFSASVQQGLQGLSDAVMSGLSNLSAWVQSTFGPAFQLVAEQAGKLKDALDHISIPDGLQRAFEWLRTNVGDKIKDIVSRLGEFKDALVGIVVPAPLLALADWFGQTFPGQVQVALDKLGQFGTAVSMAGEGLLGLINDHAVNWDDVGASLSAYVDGTHEATSATEDYATASMRMGTASKANIAALQEQRAATVTLGEETKELSEAQTNFIDAMHQALPATAAFTTALSTFGPVGQDILDVMHALADAGALGTGIGAEMAGFIDGMAEASQQLNSVLGTMNQIANLGAGLQSAQDVAQNLVGDPGVYATVDDLLANGRISLEQYNAAQADEVKIVQANTAAQEALNVMRLNQVDNLAAAAQAQSDYIVGLSHAGEAEQQHALAMMDSANQAKVAAAYSTAYAVSLGEIPATVGTDIIANAAQADPVLRTLLEQFGLVKEGAEGQLIVTFPDASNLAMQRFQAMFGESATVQQAQGLITVTQSDGTTLVYDQFNNLVEKSGTVIPATVDVKLKSLDTALASGAGFGATMDNVGSDIVTSITKQVESADYTPITTAAETKVSAAVTAVSPENLNTAEIGTSVVTDVATSITDKGANEITTAVDTVVRDAITAASTTTTDATAIGSDLVTNAAKGITDKAADFDTAATTMVTDAVKNANTEAATSDSIGIELVAQAKNGVTNDDDTFVSAATDMVSTAVNDAKSKAADALSVGQEFVAQGTSGIAQDGTNFSTQGQTMVSDAVTNAKTTAADAIGIGEEFVSQGTAGINNNKQTFADAGSQMVKDAINAAALAGAGMLATGEAIGRDLGQGLVNGMAAMVGAVQAQAAALAAAAEQGARTQLGTRSPSKVFYAIGVDTVQGFIDAIRDRVADVFKALGLLGDEATNAFEDSLGKASYDAGADAGKRLKDGMNAETVDTTDIAVGSDEWYAALHDNIMGHFENMGREGGKSLKKGLDEEVKSSSIADSLTELVDINSALQGTADAWGGIEQAISASGISSKDATTAISAMAEELRRVGSGNKELTYMADQFDLLVADIHQAGGTMDAELLDRVGRLGKELPFALENAGMAFGRFGKMSADEVVKSMAQMIEGISATLHELVDVVREAFGMAAKEGTDAFADACYPGLKDAMAGAGNVIQTGAKDWESALITTGEWAGQTIGEAMANGMSQKEADWLNQMGFVVDRAIKKGVEGGKKGASIGEETVKQAGEGVRRKERDYQDRMTEMVSKGADAATTTAQTEFVDVGEDMVNAVGKGMASQEQNLLKSIEPLIESVMQAFGDRVHTLYVIGQNVIKGFIMGMQSQADEAAAAANDLGKSAERELRKATESASPSKAAHRVGADVGKGFAEGIASGEEMTKKAARQLWRAAWKELKDNIKEGGFLGRDWAVEFWEGMLNSPNMTGPLAQWITDQMVEAADTALKKIQAKLVGIAAQLDIARNLPDPETTIPQVPDPVYPDQPNIPLPAAVDTSQRDMMQEQLEATRDLTDAITKAFEQAFSEAHKAHIAFVQGTISEEEYLSKYQAAQNAYNAKKANAAKIESLEAQVKAATAAIEAEEKARKAAYDKQVADAKAAYDAQVAEIKKAYDAAVAAREAQVEAERQAQAAQVAALEQAQRDAQMEMTQAVIDESNQRIAQYQKELSKTNDPQQKAELKAKIALEKERIDVANQLAVAITDANNASSAFDLSKANAQIEFLTAQLNALDEVDVGGMLQGIADAIMEAADKMAQAADKIKNAFGGGGKDGGEKKDKGDKGTQDASDPSLSGGGMSGGFAANLDEATKKADAFGKAGRKMGDDFDAGATVADKAIREKLGMSLDEYVKKAGESGTKAGKAIGDNTATAIAEGEVHISKQIDTTITAATLNGQKIGRDRGKSISVEIVGGMNDELVTRERDVTKTVDGVVKNSTDAAVPTAQQQGKKTMDGYMQFASQAVTQGQNKLTGDAKQVMTNVGQQTVKVAQTQGRNVGEDFGKFTAQGIKQGEKNVKAEGKNIMDRAGEEAKRDAHRLGRAAGNDLGQGVADGIRDKVRDVQQAARDLANAANSGGGGGGGAGGGASGGGKNPGGGGKNPGGGGNKGRDAVVATDQAYITGKAAGTTMAQGVADGLNAGTSAVEQAASKLIDAADKAGRKKSKSKSPSLVWMKHGHDLGDGLVLGMLDRVGDAQDAARALVYTPQGLPGGSLRTPGGNQGSNSQRGPAVTVNFNGPVNLPQVRDPQNFWPAVENLMRTHGVSSGR